MVLARHAARRVPSSTSSWCSAAACSSGSTDSPNVGLSVLATAIVALGLRTDPRVAAIDVVARSVHHGRRSPYDVLSGFTESADRRGGELRIGRLRVPTRMARLLARAPARVGPGLADGQRRTGARGRSGRRSTRGRPTAVHDRTVSTHATSMLDGERLGIAAAARAGGRALRAGRGASVRRPRRPGRASSSIGAGSAPSSPGAPTTSPYRAEELQELPTTSGRRPRRRAAPARARHP